MALFAQKLNPADVRLNYASRIEAVTYPHFERIAPDHTSSRQAEEYKYILQVCIKPHYLAEGQFIHSAQSNRAHAFTFKAEIESKQNCRLTLGDAPSQISGLPLPILRYYFEREKIKESLTRSLYHRAKEVVERMEQEFLDAEQIIKIRLLCSRIAGVAGPDYRHTLEQSLRENPRMPILPQKYRYEIDGNVFDKEKLMRI